MNRPLRPTGIEVAIAVILVALTLCMLVFRLAGAELPWLLVFGPLWVPIAAFVVWVLVPVVAENGRKEKSPRWQ